MSITARDAVTGAAVLAFEVFVQAAGGRGSRSAPLPLSALTERFSLNPGAEVVWCQEEPRNMGAWPYMLQRFADQNIPLSYAGRPEAPSPATGSYHRHQAEQEHLVRRAFE